LQPNTAGWDLLGTKFPLHEAITHGNLQVAFLLLKYGADVNGRDQKGDAPIHIGLH